MMMQQVPDEGWGGVWGGPENQCKAGGKGNAIGAPHAAADGGAWDSFFQQTDSNSGGSHPSQMRNGDGSGASFSSEMGVWGEAAPGKGGGGGGVFHWADGTKGKGKDMGSWNMSWKGEPPWKGGCKGDPWKGCGGWKGSGGNGFDDAWGPGGWLAEAKGAWGWDGGCKGWKGGKGDKGGKPKGDLPVCAVHGKPRNIAYLQENPDGSMVCKPGMECKCSGNGPFYRDADGNVKRTMCKFYMQGSCNRGEACLFAHGDEDMSKPMNEAEEAALAELLSMEQGLAEQEQNGSADFSKQQHPQDQMATQGGSNGAMVTKRTLCKFYPIGKCAKGPACTFAHSPEELGMPVMEDGGKGNGAGGPGEPKAMCWVHGKPRSVTCLMQDSPESFRCKPGSECKGGPGGVKRTMCRYFAQNGTCDKGAACTYAHAEAEIGAPIPADEWAGDYAPTWGPSCGKAGSKGWDWGAWGGDDWGCWGLGDGGPYGKATNCSKASRWGKGKGGGKGQEERPMCAVHNKPRSMSCLWQADDGSLVCRPGCECQSSGTGVKRAMCKFFERGECTKGAACGFAHDPGELGQPVAGAALDEAAGGDARYAPY